MSGFCQERQQYGAKMKRSDRLYALMQRLRDGQLHTAEAMAQDLAVSVRTIYRDMETLAESGVPVEGTRGYGYTVRAAVTLPPLNLTKANWKRCIWLWRLLPHRDWRISAMMPAACRARSTRCCPRNQARRLPLSDLRPKGFPRPRAALCTCQPFEGPFAPTNGCGWWPAKTPMTCGRCISIIGGEFGLVCVTAIPPVHS